MSEFTWRERLADWISGGVVSSALARADCNARQRNHYGQAVLDIKNATADGKSGTARMVNRMAREALQ